MLGTTHLLFSLLFGTFLLDYFHPATWFAKWAFAALLLAGTFLPDLDLYIPLLKHRGSLHTIWPIIIILILNIILNKFIPFSLAPLALGFGSHLAADALTPCGVELLAPVHKYKIKGPIRTGSWLEFVLAALIMAYLLIR